MPRSPFDILFESPDLIAINKPTGLATIPGRVETTSALEEVAAVLGLPATGSADPRLRVVHRLDKDTSGVLLFAKHTAAQRHLSHQFQNNRVEKEYLALVLGRPTEDEGTVDASLAPHPTRPREMAVTRRGRPAITHWKVEQRFRSHALIRAFPKTGKTHQIRVHLRHAGYPLAVDPLYNPAAGPLMLSSLKRGYVPTRGEEERPLIARLTLHAEKLRFEDLAGVRVEVVAPVPKDLRATVNQLGKLWR
ncbi:MAG: RluA family pseudouridine synthase [Phycisphaerae bacterium]|nr:RluA family pseudouridine synthase [Tepidisphaeraceae bacterium]